MNTFSSLAAGRVPGAANDPSPSPPPAAACFSLTCAADPGAMPRVMELFAKRGLVPDSWISRRTGPDELTVDFQLEGLEWDVADVMAHQLRQMVSVQTVLISRRHPADTAARAS